MGDWLSFLYEEGLSQGIAQSFMFFLEKRHMNAKSELQEHSNIQPRREALRQPIS
jgi:hypothetical protein